MSITTAIAVAGAMIAVAIGWSIPHVYDYHTDLRNISYQLSRIADALNRKAERREDAPVGVFAFRGELVLKTEYMNNIDGVYISDCYILSTGEKFFGGMKSTEDFKTKYNKINIRRPL